MKNILLSILGVFCLLNVSAQQSVGDYHNKFVLEALHSVDLESENVESQLKKYFANHPEGGLTPSVMSQLRTLNYGIVRKSFSSECTRYVDLIYAACKNIEDYSSFSSKLNGVLAELSRDAQVSEKERVTLEYMIDVGIKSAQLWLPRSKGGEGKVQDLLGDDSYSAREWGPIIAADIWGAAGGVVIGLLTGGVTIPVTAALGAGWASIGAFIIGYLFE